MAPVLSVILCSRNDSYRGNSRWRLQTTLNYLGAGVRALGRQSDVEVLVTDWGSETPLSEAVELGPAAAAITSFVLVPPATARALQRDSPFPEVLALNAAARRAGGQFIGRIDQDTLVGTRFLQAFFDLHEGRRALGVPLHDALLFANRRNIPYRLAVTSPPFRHLETLVRRWGRLLPADVPAERPFWTYEVGIWLAHRRLWQACGGYDETMIYFNWMETDMIWRLSQTHPIVDLGPIVNHDFYHLGHYSRFLPREPGKRRRNPPVDLTLRPGALNPNGDAWGLAEAPLARTPARTLAAADGDGPSLAGWLARAGCRAAADRLAWAVRPWRRRWQRAVTTARATLDRR
jgi:hypothetical protein